jgi:hypothetical protein
MTGEKPERSVLDALERIEGAILPTASMMLDSLLDAASLARSGFDAAAYGAQLRTLAAELEGITRQVEAVVPGRRTEAFPYRSTAASAA